MKGKTAYQLVDDALNEAIGANKPLPFVIYGTGSEAMALIEQYRLIKFLSDDKAFSITCLTEKGREVLNAGGFEKYMAKQAGIKAASDEHEEILRRLTKEQLNDLLKVSERFEITDSRSVQSNKISEEANTISRGANRWSLIATLLALAALILQLWQMLK